MSKPMLIGLHGKARTGKDTVTNHLIEKYKLRRFGPSVPVKDTTAAMFNIPRWWLDDDTMKESYVEFWGMTVRQMAQKVGKESSRDVFGDDIWLRHVERQLLQIEKNWEIDDPTMNIGGPAIYNGIILADIRYANEAEWVRDHNGFVIFLIRDNAPPIAGFEGHEGEKGLSLDLADSVIYNNGTIEELLHKVNGSMAGFFSWPTDDSCCYNEQRNVNGGCDTCGDPCL